LNRKMRPARSFHFFVFVEAREIVGGIGLHGDELIDSRVVDSGPVKSNQQRPPPAM
jgi:hypothetical protein